MSTPIKSTEGKKETVLPSLNTMKVTCENVLPLIHYLLWHYYRMEYEDSDTELPHDDQGWSVDGSASENKE